MAFLLDTNVISETFKPRPAARVIAWFSYQRSDDLFLASMSLGELAYISHHPTAEARDTTAMTSLRLLAVLNVLFKYACARQAARASS